MISPNDYNLKDCNGSKENEAPFFLLLMDICIGFRAIFFLFFFFLLSSSPPRWFGHLGLYFHIIGEGVVNIQQTVTVTDKENYIDFRMRLLGDLPHATRSGKR